MEGEKVERLESDCFAYELSACKQNDIQVTGHNYCGIFFFLA